MTAQIIFFLALALFIALTIRRVSVIKQAGSVLARFLRGVSVSLGGLTKNILRRLKSARLPRRPKVFPERAAVKSRDLPRSDHHFWAEEEDSGRRELLSHFEEGERLFREGKLKEAEHFFLRSATHNPKDPRIYAKLGLIYLQSKNYSDAIEALKVAVKLDKYNPSRYYNLSLAYRGNNDTQRAIVTVREAISLDPVTPKYRQLLEQLLEKK